MPKETLDKILDAASAAEKGKLGVAIALVIVILLIVLVKIGNVITLAGTLLDVMLFLCLFYLVYATAKYANRGITGVRKYLPGCHDIGNNINSFCSRHNGLHAGFIVFLVIFVLLDKPIVGLICSLNDSIVLGPGLLILLLALPAHGLLTKRGMKSSPQFRFLSAFAWAFVVFSTAFYYYYAFIRPC